MSGGRRLVTMMTRVTRRTDNRHVELLSRATLWTLEAITTAIATTTPKLVIARFALSTLGC
jgi:DNA-directed RNA polymerase sigma subunit (sigma70/sigma32)